MFSKLCDMSMLPVMEVKAQMLTSTPNTRFLNKHFSYRKISNGHFRHLKGKKKWILSIILESANLL